MLPHNAMRQGLCAPIVRSDFRTRTCRRLLLLGAALATATGMPPGVFAEKTCPPGAKCASESVDLYDGVRSMADDTDGDRFIESSDFDGFPNCLDGPGVGYPAGCDAYDADADGDVDLADYRVLQEYVTVCFDATPQWTNTPIPPQSNVFTIEYDAVPHEASIDGLTGLSVHESSAFSDSALTPRFNTDGYIDAYNGDISWYEADSAIPYTQGKIYHFRIEVDVPAGIYSVFVTPEGGAEQTVAIDHSFRSAAGTVTELRYMHFWAGVGSHQVCNLRLSSADGNQPPVVNVGGDRFMDPGEMIAFFSANVSDDGLPEYPGRLTLNWSKVSGPGNVTFSSRTKPRTMVTFSAAGTYVLRLTADDGDRQTSDEVTVQLLNEINDEFLVSVSDLDFGAIAQTLNFEVWNAGTGTISYTVTDNANWLSVAPASGSTSGEHDTITATVNRGGLSNGTYTASIVITPSNGPQVTLPVTITKQSTGTGLTPIARWDVVPYQRIEQGETLNAGIVAFSKTGIDTVRFRVNGGAPIDVTAMTFNTRTQVHEYWLPIRAADLSNDGPFTVEATVYGRDGGLRELPALALVANPHGTLPAPQAWVAASGGNDATGQVNNSSKRYATIGGAINGIRAWMRSNGYGDHADGGIVRLLSGTHTMDNGGDYDWFSTSTEWLTITTAAGGTPANTIIRDRASLAPATRLLRCQGVTLRSGGKYRYVLLQNDAVADPHLWIEDCDMIGSGRWVAGSHPIPQNWNKKWFTESYLYDVDFAVGGGEMARNLVIEHIGNDVFQHCPMVVNCSADDVDPGDTGWHTDAWQWFSPSGPNNTIVYNFRFSDGHYQSMMCRTGVASAAKAENVAFVNFYSELREPHRKSNGPATLWMRSVDHFLLWNCTFIGHPFNIYDDEPSIPTRITNFDVRGTVFDTLKISTPLGDVNQSSFDNNHYVVSSGAQVMTPGTNKSTGATGLDADGQPGVSSPLVNRITPPVVPGDADNEERGVTSDVGAYER